MAKLARERRVLDKQGKALLKLPNKKERSALDGEVHAGAGIMSKPQMGRHRPVCMTAERLWGGCRVRAQHKCLLCA